ncbi:MAG TPA: hypothetical protein VF247_02850 [Candidatus Krumholzibacteria bacterium]
MRRLLVLSAVGLVAACSRSGTPPVPVDDVAYVVAATDSSFVIPDTLRTGLNHFVFENRGHEVHECMFIHLPDGMSAEDFVAQVRSGIAFPEGAKDCSGPGLTSPGESVEMWVPLEEGRYITGCWLGDHMRTRKPTEFVVHGAPPTAIAPPRDDVTVRMADFRFEMAGKLTAGERVLHYVTMGPSMHEADVIRLDEGRTIDDVREFFKREGGTPPGIIAGGSMDSHDLERETWVKLNFVPGRYVFWCDMPMIQSSEKQAPDAPHVTHADAGMFKEVVVE